MTTPTFWTRDALRAAAAEGIGWLRSLGLARHPTRFDAYAKAVAAPRQEPIDDDMRRLLDEALIGIVALFWMARARIEHDAGVVERLRMMVQGSAGDARAMASGPWDAQFELLCLAIGRLARLPGLRFDEPDLLLVFRSAKYGLPIKRLTSDKPRGWRARIRHAISQLDRLGANGIAIAEAAWPGLESAADAANAIGQAAAAGVRAADGIAGGHRFDGVVVVHLRTDWRPAHDNAMLGVLTVCAGARLHNMRDQVRGEFEVVLREVGERLARRVAVERLAYPPARGELLNGRG